MSFPQPSSDPRRARYVGMRGDQGVFVVMIENQRMHRLPLRLDLRNHSPDGFEYGYAGSGPAQLALAMIAHATGDDELAVRTYLRFKDEIIAQLDRNKSWDLDKDMVAGFARVLVDYENV